MLNIMCKDKQISDNICFNKSKSIISLICPLNIIPLGIFIVILYLNEFPQRVNNQKIYRE
jgi:hypothetical protein